MKYAKTEEEKKEEIIPVKEEPKKEAEPIKEDKKEEQVVKKELSDHIVDEEGKWEDPNKKKKKIRPGQKPTTSKPVGLDAEIKISSINSTKKQEKPKQEEDILELLKPKTQPQQKPQAKVSAEKIEEDNEEKPLVVFINNSPSYFGCLLNLANNQATELQSAKIKVELLTLLK